ncbi:hypothetical protein EDB83DRAFT_2231941 [Lactarius deliciosus]|nr:hypothetical protein EDB83DRAFT_2231941 [Lactarius deliciosus]
MALPKYPSNPTEQFPSSHFLICGGSILFESTRAPLRVCLLRHNVRDEWLLPKGRKLRGEDLTVAAVRETFEETGYPCERLPLGGGARSWERRAVHADVATCGGRGGQVRLVVREVRRGEDKIRVEGTQTAVESFESAFV